MNEENNLGAPSVPTTPVAPTQTPVTPLAEAPAAQPVEAPVAQPVESVQAAPVESVPVTPIENVVTPTTTPVAVEPTPVQAAPAEPVAPIQDVTPVTDIQPVQDIAPVEAPAPVEVPVQPATVPVQDITAPEQNVVPVAEAPATQPVEAPVAQPVDSTPVAPVEAVNPVATEAAPVQAAPTEPVADPNQIFSDPTTVSAGIITPKGQAAANDVSSVGFVANDIPAAKKKNKVVPIVIVLLLFIILGVVGYFVVYPYVLRTYFSNPFNVYDATIKASAKNIENNVDEFVHTKAIYNAKFSFDTNIDTLKSFSGYKYGINYGVDPDKKSIQYGLSVNDSSNVEHSYYNYLKDGKNYKRYSSYRELIFNGEADMNAPSDLKLSFNQMLDYASKLNNQDINYLLDKSAEYLVASIDQNKLTKDDASINVNGKNIKVINNIYKVDNTTLRAMIKSIASSFSKDEKAIGIIVGLIGNEQMNADAIKKSLEELDVSKLSIDKDNDDTYIQFSIYTYGNKNTIVGFGMNVSDDSFDLHKYSLDSDYSELVIKTKQMNAETNKEVENTYQVLNKMVDGKRIITCISDDKEVAKFTLNTWTDKSKDVDYELGLDIPEKPIKLTGNLKVDIDTNDDRSNYNIQLKINSGKDYITISTELGMDWTTEVSSINTLETKELTETDLANRKTEFINTLKTTPIAQLFSTSSGIMDQSTIQNFMK